MTRAVRDRILKDASGNISDHLCCHIHLTNCIHLKNHMHKQSPVLADRSLMRDLIALQRSRSLRDPSMSPPSWRSPSVIDVLLRRGERDSVFGNGRRSIGTDRPSDGRGMMGSLQIVAPGDVTRHYNGAAALSERSSKSGVVEGRRVNRLSSRRNVGTASMAGEDEFPGVQDGSVHDNVSGNSEVSDRNNQQKGRLRQDDHLKILAERLKELPFDSEDVVFSHNHVHGGHARSHRLTEKAEASVCCQRGSLNRGRRQKFRAARRPRAPGGAKDAGAQNEMSLASNSFIHGAEHQKYHMEEGDDKYADQNVTRGPGNGCGIPWNWSRIHHGGKSFLGMAGRSLSCGLSDPRLRKGGLLPRGRDTPDIPVLSDHSRSSTKSDAEAVPLLLDASGSQGSADSAAWVHDYSGELGIFSDNLPKHEIDSDLASEARSGEPHNLQGNRHGRHQSLTQKYMPRNFRDLVGQHLVAQALSNAVVKGKVGLLYAFYGSHGTGKTSTARIFARGLNCESLEHRKPCGFCNSCVAHDMEKSHNIREIGPVSNFDFESILDLLENMIIPQLSSQYRVFIFDDCDTLSPDCWIEILKFIDRAPRHVVFILVCSSLDVLPHIIISRCQKFFFPKLKDTDIIYALQWIATKEDLEVDDDALKLIASKSDGSLRDAEMILEQLSLLGQRISVPLVQEMVGLISDEKLVDLLDLALSEDTVNTVKNLREIMESGVEPLVLMSQLATIITDILAGGYNFTKEDHRRKFFRQQALSKEDMERLRQALKTLSEAEKQLRMSNDKLTWLTATLLQLAPDQQYVFPSSTADTSFTHSSLGLYNAGVRQKPRKSNVEGLVSPTSERALSAKVRIDSQAGTSGDAYYNAKMNGSSTDRPHQANSISSDGNRVSSRQEPSKYREVEEIWLDVLEQIRIKSIKEFLYLEGKLISVSYGAGIGCSGMEYLRNANELDKLRMLGGTTNLSPSQAPTVQLVFSSHLTKSTAERFMTYILQAFESVLGSPVTIEIKCEPRIDVREGSLILPASQYGSSHIDANFGFHSSSGLPMASYDNNGGRHKFNYPGMGSSEIVEIETSPRGRKGDKAIKENVQFAMQNMGSPSVRGATTAQKHSSTASFPDHRNSGERNQNLSLVKGKVSLGHVIHQAEGCTQQSGWSKCKAISIAEKLEQENLKLEPRSRSFLCWKAIKIRRRKLSGWKIRTRKAQRLLKFVSCGRCVSGRSPS